MRCLQKEPCRRCLVFSSAFTVELRNRKFHHRVEIAGDRGLLQQGGRLADVLRYAAALFVHGGERVLRLGVAGLGGGGEQFPGAFEILRKLLSLQIEKPEVIGRAGMSELGGGIEQPGGFVEIARTRPALEVEHCKREKCVPVPFCRRELVPLRGL